MDQGFGKFIRDKRKANGLTLRELASNIGISPTYLHDIESARRHPPDYKTLQLIEKHLMLSCSDAECMYDYAAWAKPNTAPVDIADYIMEHQNLRTVLRNARNMKLSNDDWGKIIELMECQQLSKSTTRL